MIFLQSWRGLLLSCTMLAAAGTLAGCGSSSDASPSAAAAAGASDTVASSNALNPGTATSTPGALTINGNPPLSVAAGQAYAFQPVATGASGKAVQYSVSGRPSWAIFNVNTGALTGTPTSADVGVNVGIQITATDGTAAAALPAFEITVSGGSSASAVNPPASSAPAGASAANSTIGNVTLAWVAPTENTNGTSLINLGGYKIYYGTASKQYTTTISVANPATLSYVINALTVGQQYFFTVTAVSSAGVESSYSPEVSATIS